MARKVVFNQENVSKFDTRKPVSSQIKSIFVSLPGVSMKCSHPLTLVTRPLELLAPRTGSRTETVRRADRRCSPWVTIVHRGEAKPQVETIETNRDGALVSARRICLNTCGRRIHGAGIRAWRAGRRSRRVRKLLGSHIGMKLKACVCSWYKCEVPTLHS